MWNAALVSLALLPAAVLFLPALPLAVADRNLSEDPAPPAVMFAPEPMHVPANEPSTESYGTHSPADVSSPAPVEDAWPIPSAGWLLAVLYLTGVGVGLIRLTASLAAVCRL